MASRQKSKKISSVSRSFREALITKNTPQLILLLGNKDNHYLVNRTFSFKNEPLVQANICHLELFSLDRFTPLCLAILYNDLQLLDLLLEKGATQCGESRAIQVEYVQRYTPLHLASEVGEIAAVERLLNAGFDVDQEVLGHQEVYGEIVPYRPGPYRSAFFLAMSNRNLEVMEMLLKHGASLELVDGDLGSLFNVLCEETCLPLLHLIARYGALLDINTGVFSPLSTFCGFIPYEVLHYYGEELVDKYLTVAFLLFVANGYDLANDYWYKTHFQTLCTQAFTDLYDDIMIRENQRKILPKLMSLLRGNYSLKHLCRRVIRRQLYHNRKIRMPMSVDYLPLPTILKDYVSLKEPVID